jgi:uncharacterized membrane protein YkoI
MKIQMICGMMALGLMVGCATNQDRKADVAMESRADSNKSPSMGTKIEDLPAAVMNTVKAEAPNAKIDDIDKETRTGRVVYEISFAEPGKNPKLHVAEDGSVVKSDLQINEAAGAATGPTVGTKFSDLPAAVQKAIKERAPNAKIDDIDKETRTGRVIYEVQFEEPGKNPKLHFAEDGSLVEGEK